MFLSRSQMTACLDRVAGVDSLAPHLDPVAALLAAIEQEALRPSAPASKNHLYAAPLRRSRRPVWRLYIRFHRCLTGSSGDDGGDSDPDNADLHAVRPFSPRPTRPSLASIAPDSAAALPSAPHFATLAALAGSALRSAEHRFRPLGAHAYITPHSRKSLAKSQRNA